MDKEKLHFRHVMLYEFRKGITVGAATKNIQEVYLNRAPALRTVKKWFAKFRRGDFDLGDEPRSGRPSDIDDDVLRALIANNTRISTEEIAEVLNIDRSTVFRRLKKMGLTLKLDTWIPHSLSEKNKLDRISTAVSLLGRLEKEVFLDRLVTGDEKWVLYTNVKRKRTWKEANKPADSIAKAELHPKKVLLSVWWDCQGVIYFELLPVGQTIDSIKYCQQLTKLDAAMKEKRPSLVNRKGVIFHHDNARPHTSKMTLDKLKQLKWEILLHPPYSPDIAPSHYHLFRSLQNDLNGKNFDSVEAIKNHITAFFDAKPRDFFKRGIHTLVKRWKMIVENGGEYIID
ncbi:histone-lysine N-methyltransferase SETMAR-like [Camponotus floridanus]|nr:histone-lysine N-methyltransferase SETMAR-like [Camponotus floridanus]